MNMNMSIKSLRKIILSIPALWLLTPLVSAAIIGIFFAVSFTGNFPYSPEPEDFTVVDAYSNDAITFNKIGDTVTISAPLYANKQNIFYDDIIKATALRTGNLKLENAYRTSNGITACAFRFYDLQNGTLGYDWIEMPTSPGTTIGLGTFNKDQVFILQMRISTGTNTSSGEQIKFDMKMD
jgi:hypothetical protein